jgi:arylesterase/paraoxonase
MRLSLTAAVCLSTTLLAGCGAWHTTLAPQAVTAVDARCQSVKDLPALGYEDIAPDAATGSYYVSGADWVGLASGKTRPGAIYRLTPDGQGGFAVENVTKDGPAGLFPHGMDVYRSPDGKVARLFAVNHPGEGRPSRIEIFDIAADGKLVWSPDSGAHKGLERPNDVVAVGPRAFYATNDHASPRTSWFSPSARELFEDVVGARSAKVMFVDLDRGVSKIATRASFPNGIEASADGKTIYVSEVTRGAVQVFTARSDGALSRGARLKAGRMPDNLYLQDDRTLWVAIHGNALAFAAHAKSWKDPNAPHPPSPGRVLVFDLKHPEVAPRTVHATTKASMQSGGGISAVSAAAPERNGFWLGSIFEGLSYCKA